jgi:hypothetical protein
MAQVKLRGKEYPAEREHVVKTPTVLIQLAAT